MRDFDIFYYFDAAAAHDFQENGGADQSKVKMSPSAILSPKSLPADNRSVENLLRKRESLSPSLPGRAGREGSGASLPGPGRGLPPLTVLDGPPHQLIPAFFGVVSRYPTGGGRRPMIAIQSKEN